LEYPPDPIGGLAQDHISAQRKGQAEQSAEEQGRQRKFEGGGPDGYGRYPWMDHHPHDHRPCHHDKAER
jgi:hypothetical protein